METNKYFLLAGILLLAAIAGISYWLSAEFTDVFVAQENFFQSGNLKPVIVKEVKNKSMVPVPPSNADLILTSVDMLNAAKDDAELRQILLKFGPKNTMADLLADSGGGTLIDCHQEAHNIGRIAYEIFGSSAFKDGNSSCHSGYYHGAIEAFLQENGTANLVGNIKIICNSFQTSFGRFECLHGIGHGVLAYENYDLPEAIKICAALATNYDQSSCYGGMFMENITTAQGWGAGGVHETSWVDKANPYFPCDGIGDDYSVRYQCYQMQTSWMLTIFNYNFDLVKDACLKAPADMRLVCFKSFGRDAAGHTLRDADKITAICAKLTENNDYYNECVNGALNVIVDFWGDGLENQATEFCKKIPEKGKLNCYQTLNWRLADVFGNADHELTICNGFEEEYRRLCAD